MIWINKGDDMNFREVNNKLNELKQLRDVAHLTLNLNRTLASLTGYDQAVDNLEQFRNTRISELRCLFK